MGSITTKVGDRGNTALWSGEYVRKTDPRIEFCGLVDELVSQLGVCFSMCGHMEYIGERVEELQILLFTLASEVATTEPKRSKLKKKISSLHVEEIQGIMKALEYSIKLPKGWILPGKTILSANLDLARCKARECEREYVRVTDICGISNKDGMVWINRLSDFLYLLARYSESNNYRVIPYGQTTKKD